MNFYEMIDSLTIEQLREYYCEKEQEKEKTIQMYLNLKRTFSQLQPLNLSKYGDTQTPATHKYCSTQSSQFEKEIRELQK